MYIRIIFAITAAWTGPLHLLPPVALAALSLATNRDKQDTNRCVALWAYIDERDGRLLEAGLERTIISSPRRCRLPRPLHCCSMVVIPPVLLPASPFFPTESGTYRGREELIPMEPTSQGTQPRKRERRLSNRELISNKLNAASSPRRTKARDDGVGHSFQRSRGHRMVDSSLDLYGHASKH